MQQARSRRGSRVRSAGRGRSPPRRPRRMSRAPATHDQAAHEYAFNTIKPSAAPAGERKPTGRASGGTCPSSRAPTCWGRGCVRPRGRDRSAGGTHEADEDHERDQAKHTAKVVVLSFACEAGELRQQQGLHGLKEHQRDTSDEQSCDEQCNAVLLGRRGEQLDAEHARVRQESCEDRSEQKPAERTRQLGVRRLGPGGEQASSRWSTTATATIGGTQRARP